MTASLPNEPDAALESPVGLSQEEAGPVRQPAPRFGLVRFASPSFLLLALFVFPLPWIQIQCVSERVPSDAPPEPQTKDDKIPVGLLPLRDEEPMCTESGLQAALGTCTIPSKSEDTSKQEAELAAHLSASPMMAAWPALVGGALAALFQPVGRRQRWAVSVCVAAALLLLGAQVLIHFPIVRAMEKDAASRSPPEPAAEQPPAEPRGAHFYGIDSDGKRYWIRHGVRAAYTLWFYVAVLGVLAPLALCAFEGWRDRRRTKATAPPSEPCEPGSPARSP